MLVLCNDDKEDDDKPGKEDVDKEDKAKRRSVLGQRTR